MGAHKQHPDSLLVGGNRVTLVGLVEALKAAARSGLSDRERLVDSLMLDLGRENFIPEAQRDAYRTALWREYLRSRGADFSAFYSEMPVTVSGPAGAERDRFVEMLGSIFAEMELRPVVSFAVAGAGKSPQLVINDQVIVEGLLRRTEMRAAIQKSFSGW